MHAFRSHGSNESFLFAHENDLGWIGKFRRYIGCGDDIWKALSVICKRPHADKKLGYRRLLTHGI